MDNTKVNDWFAARLLNLDKGPGILIDNGINVENSKLEDRDVYKNKLKVQEMFKKEDGTFDEDNFNKFYDNISNEYIGRLYLEYVRKVSWKFFC